MRRRDFLRGMGAAACAAPLTNRLLGSGAETAKLPFDLVAVKDGEPEAMFDKAIESLGGMKAFVQRNQKVLVKPNIGWSVTPECGANTHPGLVRRVIEHCLKAGAKEVVVFDHTCNEWRECYDKSGIEKAAKTAGGKVAPGHDEKYYQAASVAKAKKLTNVKEHELLGDCDVFINLPVLKCHKATSLTIAMKNLMGVVWDRKFWHGNDLHQCIADYACFRQPDLNIVDAYRVMKANGPRGKSEDDIVMMKALLVSPHLLAVDAAAAKLYGMNPEDVGYMKMAQEAGLGSMSLEGLRINRLQS